MNKILSIGTSLRERYKITDVLSHQTGFGITYKILDYHHPNKPTRILKQLKKPTAAKLEIEHLSTTEQEIILNQYWLECLRLFRIETQALAKLGEAYQQIPTIFEYFDEQDEYFYVQEYIEGLSLTAEVRQGKKLSKFQTVSLLIEILEILEYVQTYPNYSVIHRDIKPENIIRKKVDNKLVLIDFGLAKEITVSGTKIGSIKGGTKGYIGPEILLRRVSFASDIYSVGMIGIFAITGEDPAYTALLAENWQSKANVNQEFANVLNKMICESYKQRFQNATEALVALRKLLNTTPPIQLTLKLIFGLIVVIFLAVVLGISTIILTKKTDIQLIADGQEQQGQLTQSDPKELINGKPYDIYKFISTKQKYLTVEIVSKDFNPIITIRKIDEKNFSVKNVSSKDNNFTATVMLEKGEYELKIKSKNVTLGNYAIKAWISDK